MNVICDFGTFVDVLDCGLGSAVGFAGEVVARCCERVIVWVVIAFFVDCHYAIDFLLELRFVMCGPVEVSLRVGI